MATFNPVVELQLPWSSSSKEDKRYFIILFIFLLFMSIFSIYMNSVELPKVDRKELDKKAQSKAKLIIKKKEEFKRVEPPKVIPKPVAKTEPVKQAEPKKVAEVKKPLPVAKQSTTPVSHAEKVKQAQEVAKNAGILKMKDDLATMRSAFKGLSAGGGIKTSSLAGAKGAGVSRSVIVGSGVGGSGGIKVASGPASSGMGIGTGGGAGSGRGDTNVDSISLGGKVADVGGTVEKAVKSASSVGNRSEESIRAALDSNKSALYAIYNRALREDPTLQGKVTFKIVIEPDGSVSGCSIVSSDINDSTLGNKLISRMKMINFGADDVAKTTTQWAIDFLPN